MAWPKGKPRVSKPLVVSTKEQLVAIYLSKFVCMTPGCDHKLHYEDARNIIGIIQKEVE